VIWLKKETGNTAQEYVQSKLIDIAKEKIYDPGKTMSQIAYELNFKYPQHFARLFKQRVGYSPLEFRTLN
jgi:AraC-like DNA-binding protein